MWLGFTLVSLCDSLSSLAERSCYQELSQEVCMEDWVDTREAWNNLHTQGARRFSLRRVCSVSHNAENLTCFASTPNNNMGSGWYFLSSHKKAKTHRECLSQIHMARKYQSKGFNQSYLTRSTVQHFPLQQTVYHTGDSCTCEPLFTKYPLILFLFLKINMAQIQIEFHFHKWIWCVC